MTQRQKKQAKKILNSLERQPFYDFYAKENGEFDQFLQNRIGKGPADRSKKENKILERITELFELS